MDPRSRSHFSLSFFKMKTSQKKILKSQKKKLSLLLSPKRGTRRSHLSFSFSKISNFKKKIKKFTKFQISKKSQFLQVNMYLTLSPKRGRRSHLSFSFSKISNFKKKNQKFFKISNFKKKKFFTSQYAPPPLP